MVDLEQQYPALGDDDDDEVETEGDGALNSGGAMGGDASEKLRRAVRSHQWLPSCSNTRSHPNFPLLPPLPFR